MFSASVVVVGPPAPAVGRTVCRNSTRTYAVVAVGAGAPSGTPALSTCTPTVALPASHCAHS